MYVRNNMYVHMSQTIQTWYSANNIKHTYVVYLKLYVCQEMSIQMKWTEIFCDLASLHGVHNMPCVTVLICTYIRTYEG
jgi:hypothetical protein